MKVKTFKHPSILLATYWNQDFFVLKNKFCDIENLARFSKTLAKLVKFTVEKNPRFSLLYCKKKEKFQEKIH
jgi:hypothetical protein